MQPVTPTTTTTTVRTAEAFRKPHPIRGILWGLIMGIGAAAIAILLKIIPFELVWALIVLGGGILLGILWSTLGPAKKPKGDPPWRPGRTGHDTWPTGMPGRCRRHPRSRPMSNPSSSNPSTSNRSTSGRSSPDVPRDVPEALPDPVVPDPVVPDPVVPDPVVRPDPVVPDPVVPDPVVPDPDPVLEPPRTMNPPPPSAPPPPPPPPPPPQA